MSENTNTITVSTKYGDVVYDIRRQTWVLGSDRVGEEAVKIISETTHKEITALLTRQVEEYQARIEKEKEEREATAKAELETDVAAFRATVEPLIMSGFTLSSVGADSCRIGAGGEHVSVSFSGRIYGGDRFNSFHGHKTDKPWEVRTNWSDYRTIRYGTIERAVTSAMNKLEEMVDKKNKDAKVTGANASHFRTQQETFKALGINVNEVGREKIASVVVKEPAEKYSSKVTVNGIVSNTNVVSNVSIVGKFTPDHFRMLSEFVRELDLEPGN